ncbi:unnamed protein product [Lathyrus sativus]|nr:unnamed protein product [Lathyrus sativus]
MHSRPAIVHILGLLALTVIISSEVTARVFTETSSNTKNDVEKINEANKVSYGFGGYRGFGGVYPVNGGYLNNGGVYPSNGAGYFGNGGYGGGFPINGGGYPGNGGYGGGYPGNVGGNNVNNILGNVVGSIADFIGNIGDLIGGQGGAAVAKQSKDNTRN